MNLTALSQVREWAGGTADFNPAAFVMYNVSVAEAAVLSTLLWPDFVEYDGCVLLAFKFDEAGVSNWLDHLEGDRRAVEAVVNHVHLWDVLAAKAPEEYAALSALAGRIAPMWRAAARAAFPEREFDITVTDDPDDYGPTVTFASAS